MSIKFKGKVTDKNSKNKLTKFIKDFNKDNLFDLEIKSIDKKDGLKINLNDNSWLLLRLSGTEPVVRIYCESKNEKSVNDLISNFIKYIKVKLINFRNKKMNTGK